MTELSPSSEGGQPSPLVMESEAKLGGVDMTVDLLWNECHTPSKALTH